MRNSPRSITKLIRTTGIRVKYYRDRHQVFVFSGEGIEELWGFEHLCDRFFVEIFEVLETALELP